MSFLVICPQCCKRCSFPDGGEDMKLRCNNGHVFWCDRNGIAPIESRVRDQTPGNYLRSPFVIALLNCLLYLPRISGNIMLTCICTIVGMIAVAWAAFRHQATRAATFATNSPRLAIGAGFGVVMILGIVGTIVEESSRQERIRHEVGSVSPPPSPAPRVIVPKVTASSSPKESEFDKFMKALNDSEKREKEAKRRVAERNAKLMRGIGTILFGGNDRYEDQYDRNRIQMQMDRDAEIQSEYSRKSQMYEAQRQAEFQSIPIP